MNEKDTERDPEELSPEEQKKADRAIVILYVVMFIFIIAPFLVWLLMKGS